MKIEPFHIAQKIREALKEKKGEDIVILDVRNLSDVTDYYVIATGKTPPHIGALIQEVEHALDQAGIRCYRRAGTPESQWIVADYVDVVAHIFSPLTRRYYDLERLWRDAKMVS